MRPAVRVVALAGFIAFGFVACRDQLVSPTGERASPAPNPSAQIVDGAHSTGNKDFFFLPPLVADPSGQPAFDAGQFDATLSPRVEICLGSALGCAASQPTGFPIVFTPDGPGSERVRVDQSGEWYTVNWRTKDFRLNSTATYRIRVLVAGSELGRVDVGTGSDPFVPLKDGGTLPIKFRIEKGAVFVVGKSGGTIVAEGGAVTLTFPPRTNPIGITVDPAANPPADSRVLGGTTFDLGPGGTAFSPPATLSIKYDPNAVPNGKYPRLHKVIGGVWTPVPGSTADLVNHVVTAPIDGFSTWGVLGTGVVLTVHVAGGQGQVTVEGGDPPDPCSYLASTCVTDFPAGTSIALNATALSPDARFEDWSSAGPGFSCTTNAHCPFDMTQDRDVTARFSMPGIITLDHRTAAFSMAQSGSASPASDIVTLSNIGGRAVTLETRVAYGQMVRPWLSAVLSNATVAPGTPQTLTTSVLANVLPPGTYNATVVVGDGNVTINTIQVTLTVSAAALYAYDGTGKHVGPLPLIAAAFTSSDGTDPYPVAAGETYIFTLFDTGADLVYVSQADNLFLAPPGGMTSSQQNTRVRVSGLGGINATTLQGVVFAVGAINGAQAEVPNVRVAPRASAPATLIGAPVFNNAIARIDNTTTVTRGPYAFCNCNFSAPDITFYQSAASFSPTLQLPLERYVRLLPPPGDNATRGQLYFLNDVVFRNGSNAVMDDFTGAAPVKYLYDTGTSVTLISTRLATSLGINYSVPGVFDCLGANGNGYVIDQVAFAGTTTTGGVGSYVINHASVCVDVDGTGIILSYDYTPPGGVSGPRKFDAVIGSNLFSSIPVLFDGPGNKLGILP